MIAQYTAFALLASASVGPSLVEAHMHARSEAELSFHAGARRSLAACQGQLRRRGVFERSIARRQILAGRVRRELGLPHRSVFLKKRDAASVLATSHASNLTGLTTETEPSLLFSGNSSCVLGPEVTQGPYYVSGEYVRSDVREDQAGIPLYVDIELIDVTTCEPVPNLYMDFWHANATGVYSGVVARGNGDSTVAANLNSTFLRGVQQTDSDGVAQFTSIVPGHYTGRTEHIHVIVHQSDGVLSSNGTYSGLNVAHVGQIFFDQDLLTAVDAVEPYASNTQGQTLNSEDSILAEQADGIDPVLEYVLLGDSVSDGILAWTSMGIDTSATHTTRAAATLTENGGVANSNGGMGGGSGAPPGGSGGASTVTRSSSATSATSSALNSTAAQDSATSGSSTVLMVSLGQLMLVLVITLVFGKA